MVKCLACGAEDANLSDFDASNCGSLWQFVLYEGWLCGDCYKIYYNLQPLIKKAIANQFREMLIEFDELPDISGDDD